MKKKILMVGPFLSQSGYGYQARFALSAVRSSDEFDIYLVNTSWGRTTWLHDDDDFREYVDEKIKKTISYKEKGGTFDVHLQISIPNEIQQRAPINIMYTAGIETTKVAPQWLDKIRQLNSMIVVSNHAKNVFESTKCEVQDQNGNKFMLGCETPIDVVNYPVGEVELEKIKLDVDYDYNFLAVAQWSPRKNLENLIRWFYDEFNDDYVGLVLKCSVAGQNTRDRMATENKLKALLEDIKQEYLDPKCKMYLVHGDLTSEEMRGLYTHPCIRALVSTTHGEGFGLPLFEAAYNGLPVVTHGWSGQSDFLYHDGKPYMANCDFNILPVQKEAVWNGVITEDSQWAHIDGNSFRKKMRDVYQNYYKYDELAQELKEKVEEKFTKEKMYSKFVDSILKHFRLDQDEIDSWLNDMVLHGDDNEENKEEE